MSTMEGILTKVSQFKRSLLSRSGCRSKFTSSGDESTKPDLEGSSRLKKYPKSYKEPRNLMMGTAAKRYWCSSNSGKVKDIGILMADENKIIFIPEGDSLEKNMKNKDLGISRKPYALQRNTYL